MLRCNFGATLEENLRSKLIEKLLYVELKRKLLDVNKIALEASMDKVGSGKPHVSRRVKWSRQGRH